MSFREVFDRFIEEYKMLSNKDNQGLHTYYEPEWLSPCYPNTLEIDIDEGDEVTWSPFKRESSVNLSNLETALEIDIPQSLHDYFCRYFSHDINASAEYGGLTLIQAWNEADFDRLQKNLIAHVLMKRRLKQDDTLFIALTDEDSFVLSVLLKTGEVVLEEVGRAPTKIIAPDLKRFIQLIKPAPAFVCL
ncbi:SecY-interacting protein [Glaciecola petra]|uniref:SecY-interacting protein n=1 Tax=Glaciecola petra TaxID=3075602 RepID=A0ABU2ZM32_9ALTE|nr:SecY-interacting protein [Aestuariibacter sp. P117]MDT0593684.1 SecY-interacting protein [Aestuariibacter sp. P117]